MQAVTVRVCVASCFRRSDAQNWTELRRVIAPCSADLRVGCEGCRVKGLILAGGRGTRLRPITYTSAKQLVPVANKPILFYGLEHLAQAGIADIAVIVGETGEEVRSALGDGSRWNVNLTFIDQPEPLGLAHCVLLAKRFLGDDDFVMYLGDNLLQHGLVEIMDRFVRDRSDPRVAATAAHILLSKVPDPHRFGVAVLEGNEVVGLVEKPLDPPSDLAMAGVYLFTPTIHRAVAAIGPSSRGELEIVDAIQWLIDHGEKVSHEILEGWWLDTGKKDSLLEANRRVLEDQSRRVDGRYERSSTLNGAVVIEAGAEVDDCVVQGPVVIGAGSRLKGSRIGPFTAVGEDAVITNCRISNSVLLDRVNLHDVDLVDSLLGRGAEVSSTGRATTSARLMVGDDCTVEFG